MGEEVAAMATTEEVVAAAAEAEVAAVRKAAVEAAAAEVAAVVDAHRRFEPVAHRVPVVVRTRIKNCRRLIAKGRRREDTARASKGDSRTLIWQLCSRLPRYSRTTALARTPTESPIRFTWIRYTLITLSERLIIIRSTSQDRRLLTRPVDRSPGNRYFYPEIQSSLSLFLSFRNRTDLFLVSVVTIVMTF